MPKRPIQFVFLHRECYKAKYKMITSGIDWDPLVSIVYHLFHMKEQRLRVTGLEHGCLLKREDWRPFMDAFEGDSIPFVVHSEPIPKGEASSRDPISSEDLDVGKPLPLRLSFSGKVRNAAVSSATSWKDCKALIDAIYGLSRQGRCVSYVKIVYSTVIGGYQGRDVFCEEDWKTCVGASCVGCTILAYVYVADVPRGRAEASSPSDEVRCQLFRWDKHRSIDIAADTSTTWKDMKEIVDVVFDLKKDGDHVVALESPDTRIESQEDWDTFLDLKKDGKGDILIRIETHTDGGDLASPPPKGTGGDAKSPPSGIRSEPKMPWIEDLWMGDESRSSLKEDADHDLIRVDQEPVERHQGAGLVPSDFEDDVTGMNDFNYGENPACDLDSSTKSRLLRSEGRVITMESRMDRMDQIVGELMDEVSEWRASTKRARSETDAMVQSSIEKWIRDIAHYIHIHMDFHQSYGITWIWNLVVRFLRRTIPLNMVDRAMAYGMKNGLFRIKVGDVILYERV